MRIYRRMSETVILDWTDFCAALTDYVKKKTPLEDLYPENMVFNWASRGDQTVELTWKRDTSPTGRKP